MSNKLKQLNTFLCPLNIFFSNQLYFKQKNAIKDEVFNTLILILFLKFTSFGKLSIKFRWSYIEVSD